MLTDFGNFLNVFPPENRAGVHVDGERMARAVTKQFGVSVPDSLKAFWSAVGSGYFADRELYVFGEGDADPRNSLIEWNGMDFWPDVFSPHDEGGLLIFAETCFGTQIGFRLEDGKLVPCALDVDGIELFGLANTFDGIFDEALADRDALTDLELLTKLKKRLGPLPDGMHYAPIVGPNMGGDRSPSNFHFESPNLHLRVSIAAWQAAQQSEH